MGIEFDEVMHRVKIGFVCIVVASVLSLISIVAPWTKVSQSSTDTVLRYFLFKVELNGHERSYDDYKNEAQFDGLPNPQDGADAVLAMMIVSLILTTLVSVVLFYHIRGAGTKTWTLGSAVVSLLACCLSFISIIVWNAEAVTEDDQYAASMRVHADGGQIIQWFNAIVILFCGCCFLFWAVIHGHDDDEEYYDEESPAVAATAAAPAPAPVVAGESKAEAPVTTLAVEDAAEEKAGRVTVSEPAPAPTPVGDRTTVTEKQRVAKSRSAGPDHRSESHATHRSVHAHTVGADHEEEEVIEESTVTTTTVTTPGGGAPAAAAPAVADGSDDEDVAL